MKTLVFAPGGALVSQADTGSNAAPVVNARANVYMGYWPASAGPPPTTFAAMRACANNGTTAGQMDVVFAPDTAGSVLSFGGWCDGLTGAIYTWQLQKNAGVNTGITATLNSGGPSAFGSNKVAAGTVLFVPGDYFYLKVMAASGAAARNLQAFLTVAYTTT